MPERKPAVPQPGHRRAPRARIDPLRLVASLVPACLALIGLSMPPLPPPPSIEGALSEPVSFMNLPGWAADDHLEAYRAFLASCRARRDRTVALRLGEVT